MATNSSSDESSMAPKDFHISTSTDSGSRLSPNRQRCPLCRRFRKTFYCKDCIHSGLFYSSRFRATEGYIDKQKALLELEDSKKTLEKNCLKLLDNKLKCDILHSKIRQAKDRNRILKVAVEDKKQTKTTNTARIIELKEKNEKRNKSLPKYNLKVQELEDFVSVKREKVEKLKEAQKQKQEELKKLVRLRIQQLFKFIFPISVVKPTVEAESSTDDMVSALAEASRTTFIRDRWEYSDYSSEMKYCIAGPTLPGSGNYSAYNIWVAQNQDAVPSSNTSNSVESNPAFSISAALTYTAQLVSILSFYLNVRLPYKMVYSDFCSGYMNEQQFARRTARLNANILYMCFSQNVDLCSLRSCETIHNILQLIEDEKADLGRQGPMEYDMHQASALEQLLTENLKTSEDSDSEEADTFPVEWEAVPHVACPEVPPGAAMAPPQSPQQMTSTQQASSMAGGLVNSAAASIASFWRGFTGR
ncbi:unnamed protein product [Callosobruchus maculatus]|uniref:Beclin 1-associated autophagy-related key regulator n=1 Tax=Callosobruchus maculatus TaxID=64391 RepID=A0A653D1T3_CALMS|nr:unnamed protein product [Callosobruchus maculatus]